MYPIRGMGKNRCVGAKLRGEYPLTDKSLGCEPRNGGFDSPYSPLTWRDARCYARDGQEA
jgi:hypothetical protein